MIDLLAGRTLKMTTPSGSPSSWTVKDVQQNSGLLPTIAVTLWLGWNGVVVGSTFYAIFFASNTTRMLVLGLFTLSLMLPSEFPGKLGYRFGDWMMSHAEIYFGLKTIIEERMASWHCPNKTGHSYSLSALTMCCHMEVSLKSSLSLRGYSVQLNFFRPSSIRIQSITEKTARKARESRVLSDDVRGLSSSSAQARLLLGSGSTCRQGAWMKSFYVDT